MGTIETENEVSVVDAVVEEALPVVEEAPKAAPKVKKAKEKAKAKTKPKAEAVKVKPVVEKTEKKATAKKAGYEQWLKDQGSELIRRGLGQRNILLKAAKAAGAGFDEVMLILGQNISLREKLLKIFKE